MDKIMLDTTKKYIDVINQDLNESQRRELKIGLHSFETKEDICISDPCVNIVYDMIIADIMHQMGV